MYAAAMLFIVMGVPVPVPVFDGAFKEGPGTAAVHSDGDIHCGQCSSSNSVVYLQ